MKIHTFGDSHSSNIISGWKDCNNIVSHHLGPVLCYSFGKEKLNRLDLTKYEIEDNDTIIFCFGEIDCRCHIQKHITDTVKYYDIINTIVNNYIEAIKLNLSNLKNIKLKNVCIYNVVPPVRKINTP